MFVRVKHGHPLSIRSGFFDVRANRHESARIYACLRFFSDSLDLDLGQLIWSSVLLVE